MRLRDYAYLTFTTLHMMILSDAALEGLTLTSSDPTQLQRRQSTFPYNKKEGALEQRSTQPLPRLLSSLCSALSVTLRRCRTPILTCILDLLAPRSLRHIHAKLDWATPPPPNFSLCEIFTDPGLTFSRGRFHVRYFYGGGRHLLTPEFSPPCLDAQGVGLFVVMISPLRHAGCLRV